MRIANGKATKRINEHYDDMLNEYRGGSMQNYEREILAIKRYLDELADRAGEATREGEAPNGE